MCAYNWYWTWLTEVFLILNKLHLGRVHTFRVSQWFLARWNFPSWKCSNPNSRSSHPVQQDSPPSFLSSLVLILQMFFFFCGTRPGLKWAGQSVWGESGFGLVGQGAGGGRAGAVYGPSTHVCPLMHWVLVPSLLVKFNEAQLCHSSKMETFWLSVVDESLNSRWSRFKPDPKRPTFVILSLGLLFVPVTFLSDK